MPGKLYDVLDVDDDASRADIRRAYRRTVKEAHPDVSDHPNASERFQLVLTAREVLTDPDERARYDDLGHDAYMDWFGEDDDDGSSSGSTSRTADADTGSAGDSSASSGDSSASTGAGGSGGGTASGDGSATASGSTDSTSGDDATASGSANAAAGSDTATSATGASSGASTGGGSSGSTGSSSGSADAADSSDASASSSTGTGAEADPEAGTRAEADAGTEAEPESSTGDEATSETSSGASASHGNSSSVSASAVADAAERTRKEWQARARRSDSGGQGPWSSSSATGGRTRAEGVDTGIATRIRSRDTAVLAVVMLVAYPIFVFGVVWPQFPLAVKVLLAVLTVAVVVYTLTEPSVSLVVFGTWSVLTPLLLVFFDQPLVSLGGLFVLSVTWIPFLLAVLLTLAMPD